MNLAALLAERLGAGSEPEPAAPLDDDAELLRSPDRILLLIERVFSQRALLTVAVQGSDELFTSVILEVNADGGYLVIDELRPSAGHDAMRRGRNVHISSRLDGVSLSFSSVVERIETEPNGAYYKIPLPAQVHYYQKRNYYRVNVPVSRSLAVLLVLDDQRSIAGELRDLSLGGFSMRLNPGAPHRLRVGEHIEHCILHLDSRRSIETAVEIRYVEDAAQHKRPRVGASFVDISQRQLRAVEATVSALERDQLRLAARTH